MQISARHNVFLRTLFGIILNVHDLKTHCMKTLLIVTGVILISFQINRIIVNNSDSRLLRSEVKIFDDKYSEVASPKVIDSTYRSVKSIKEATTANIPVASVEVKTNAIKNSVFTKSAVKSKKSRMSGFSTESNNNFKALHKLIKDSKTYISFTTVQYDFNKHKAAALETEEFNNILQFADQLIFDHSLKVSIAGFADSIGSTEYNEQISWMRALDIQKYFVELGVNEDQIMISANGSADPVASNTVAEGRAENRRVELALVK